MPDKTTENSQSQINQAVSHVAVDLAGQNAMLLPQKAIYLAESETIVVADVHVGKGASFRSRSFFAPEGVTERDLERLTELVTSHKAKRLLILGDLIHAQDGLTPEETALFDTFRQQHLALSMVLIIGNHDRKAKVPESWHLEQVRGDMHEGPFTFAHEYEARPAKKTSKQVADAVERYTLCGHIHPAVNLYGKARQRERLPCFWVRNKYAVLPSFGTFTGSFTIKPSSLDRVFVVARDTVIAL
jgi:DNA ligase-associated metallophosphoesterase